MSRARVYFCICRVRRVMMSKMVTLTLLEEDMLMAMPDLDPVGSPPVLPPGR